jgi:hypothetical protein
MVRMMSFSYTHTLLDGFAKQELNSGMKRLSVSAYKVKITSTKKKKLTDSSDNNFTITK